ncbi:hypothetical protein HLA97_14055 [Gordonia araii NBRC 100433]|nr:hypothetical protein [Gordonia araii NBRC 100433]
MTQVIDHVSTRAQATPRLTAVRFGGKAVSYGELGNSIDSYADVMSRHGMSADASLVAGIVNSMPAVAELGEKTGAAVSQVIDWLGRELDSSGGTHLRAVS